MWLSAARSALFIGIKGTLEIFCLVLLLILIYESFFPSRWIQSEEQQRFFTSMSEPQSAFHVNILLGELLFAADKPNQTGEYLPSKECGSDGPAQKDKINQPILGPFPSFT